MKHIDLKNEQKAKVTKVKAVMLEMIINGQPEKTLAKLDEPLSAARDKALKSSGNIGRKVDEWQIRDVNGVLLEEQRILSDFKFTDGTRIFVSLAVGVGGSLAGWPHFARRAEMDRREWESLRK